VASERPRSYFPDWNPKTDKVVHVLLVIKKIFKTMHTRAEPCNRDAAHLLATDEEAFKTSVRDCVRESIENIYRSPPLSPACGPVLAGYSAESAMEYSTSGRSH
jgi:hypothetical protein